MPTDLEKYLHDHRKELDVESPDDQLIWEGIRQDLQRSRPATGRRKLWIRIRNMSAIIIIAVSVGYMMVDIIGDRRSSVKITLSDIDRDLGAREQEYRKIVSFKEQEVSSFNQTDNMIIAELFEEIQKLDTIYEETLKDLNELGYNEQVIQTIFDTYEKKIYLLELIILENNKIKNHEKEENLFL
jgi:hypothetical protein